LHKFSRILQPNEKCEALMVGLDTEKKTYSSRVFVQNPKTRITPAKNPNKNLNSIILKAVFQINGGTHVQEKLTQKNAWVSHLNNKILII